MASKDTKTKTVTRAQAKKWFLRNHPGVRIERTVANTFYISHRPNFICSRYYGFKMVNPYHCDYVPTPD